MRTETRPSGTTRAPAGKGGAGDWVTDVPGQTGAEVAANARNPRPIGKDTAAALGLTPAQIAAQAAAAAAGAGATGEEDPPVWMGDRSATLSSQINRFYSLNPQQLRTFQQRAFVAGLVKNPRYGDYDEESFAAWGDLNRRAARFLQAGKRFTLGAVLDMAEANAPAEDQDADRMGRDGRQGDVATLAGKVDLEEQVQQAARGKLNRKLKPKEVERFVAIYQVMQRKSIAQQRAAALAAEGGQGSVGVDGAPGADSTLIAPPDASTAATQFLDNGFAQEAAGEEAYGYLEALRGLIGDA